MNVAVNTEDSWPIRRAKARVTRASIIEAAGDLFVELGYLGTSIQAIADRAGVSRATVFNSVGGKLHLLRAAFDVATVGDDEPIPLTQRREARAVLDEPDKRKAVGLYAVMVTGVSERVVGIYEVFRSAAGVDLEAREQWAQIQSERLAGAHGFVRILRTKGPLKKGLNAKRAGDVVWTLIDASLYQRLVVERGWTSKEFEHWLARRMATELLPLRD